MTKYIFLGSHAKVTGLSGKVYHFKRDTYTGNPIEVEVDSEDIAIVSRLEAMKKVDSTNLNTAKPTSYRTVKPKVSSKKKRRKINKS